MEVWLKRVSFSLLLSMFFASLVFGSKPEKKVIIKFDPEVSVAQVDSLTNALGLSRIKSIDEIDVDVFEISSQHSVNEVVQMCSSVPYVVYAEPTAAARAFAIEEPTPESNPEPPAQAPAEVAEHVPGEVIVKFKSTVSQQTATNILSRVGIQITKSFDEIGVLQCNISGPEGVLKVVEECNADPNIEYAEPNYIYRRFVTPNDPRFSSLFGMTITDAPEAWDKQTGSKSVIVGVIDTGIDTDHEDLVANIWSNPGETGDGKEDNEIDDDNNGFVDDFRGWDFINNDNDPFDDNQHGTHVSGTIGAEGNNEIGVVGVNWSVSIMPLKFLGRDGSGTTDDAVEAIVYGTNNGAKVLSNSWGGGGRSQALQDAIEFANDNGVLFVAAAGNEFSNNDRFPTFPANYEVPNVVSVAASTSGDDLAGFSNFGRRTVHLAAPGSNIVSTVPRDLYASLSGTSMATPHVSGAAALVWAEYPNLTMRQVKTRLLGSVDRNPDFADEVITGGRLNVNNAISTNPVINTTRLENTLDETGPYVVEADIVDDGSVQSATLTYQIMGQEAVSVDMTAQGDDRFTGDIPGQALGTTIVYFVSAEDNDGNETRDSNFTFAIAEPEDDGCGCGRPAIDVAIEDANLKSTVNAVANVFFFLLPFVAIKFHAARRKKRADRK